MTKCKFFFLFFLPFKQLLKIHNNSTSKAILKEQNHHKVAEEAFTNANSKFSFFDVSLVFSEPHTYDSDNLLQHKI